jgi:uncharacterized protein
MRLGAEQGRVIGSLIEKQLTTPQQYPLSLNALVQACNQLSNRDPVVSYDERVVDETLMSLKEAGLVRFVHPSHGRSVTRYRQVLEERLGLDDQQLALVAVLLLRGPQTVGELRARTERMASFDGISTLDGELDRLAALPEPLAARLTRRPGQKEERWAQLLMDAAPTDEPEPAGAPGGASLSRLAASEPAAFATTVRQAPESSAGPGEVAGPDGEVAALREEVADLRDEVADLRGEVIDLRADLEDLQARLGGL